jgi:hypothetical protein
MGQMDTCDALRVLCDCACLIAFDVHLLQIRIFCCEANHTPDITLHKAVNHFPSVLLNIRHVES